MPLLALIVDDSMLIRHTVCRFLEERGFVVESAANGREALEALERMIPTSSSPTCRCPRWTAVS